MKLREIIAQWTDGSISANEAMVLIAEMENRKANKPKPQKREIDYDVSSFLGMANAIVNSRMRNK